MRDDDFQQLQYPNIAAWKNNPRVATARSNQASQSSEILPATDTGRPLPVRGVRVQTKKTSAGVEVTLSHLVDPSDTAHSHVDVWANGYLGNKQPVKVSSGTSPHTFVLPATGEKIALQVQSIGKDGSILPLRHSPTVSTKL